MALITRELLKLYHFMNVEISDPRMTNYPLMSSWLPIIAIIGTYAYVATVLGPKLMKNRPPFKLDRIIQVYNVVQICISTWLVERAITLGWWSKYSMTCELVDYSDSPDALMVANMAYIYFLVKASDLLDTVFFLLRKKNNQVSFLHVYHHAGMLLGSWIGVKYIPGGHLTFIPIINSFVHAVMYSYYLLTNMYPHLKKNAWWKKYITQMQMIQFLLITVHTGQLLFQPNCKYPKIVPILLTPHNLMITLLFWDFYRKSYTRTTSAKTKTEQALKEE